MLVVPNKEDLSGCSVIWVPDAYTALVMCRITDLKMYL